MNNKILVSILASIMLAGCECEYDKPTQTPTKGLYTIALGSVYGIVEISTDSYKIDQGMVVFVNKENGMKTAAPLSGVYLIVNN